MIDDVLQMEDVGDPLEKIRIGHDDSGIGPAWHLTKVEVRKMLRGQKGSVLYEFPCNRWLAKNREDGAIARDLVCARVVEELPDSQGHLQRREFDRRDSLKSTLTPHCTVNERLYLVVLYMYANS